LADGPTLNQLKEKSMDRIKETRTYSLQLSHELLDDEIKEAKDWLDKATKLLSDLNEKVIGETFEERLGLSLDKSWAKKHIESAKKELKDCLKKKLELPVE
jgi:vacuolar-type H+-ATPase subunit H